MGRMPGSTSTHSYDDGDRDKSPKSDHVDGQGDMNANAKSIMNGNAAFGSSRSISIGWWFAAAVAGILIWATLFSLAGLLF